MSDWKENVTGAMPCKSFDMVDVWFRDGDLSSGFASDFYWKIDHDIVDIIKYKVRESETETPEEKEAFDSMVNNSELPNDSGWNGEGLPPAGVECEFSCEGFWGDSDYHWCRFLGFLSDKSYAIEFHHPTSPSKVTCQCFDPQCTSFRKSETPQQREERERLEAGKSLYELVQYLWCTVDSKYTPHPYNSPLVDEKTKEMYARLAKAVDYRKAK